MIILSAFSFILLKFILKRIKFEMSKFRHVFKNYEILLNSSYENCEDNFLIKKKNVVITKLSGG